VTRGPPSLIFLFLLTQDVATIHLNPLMPGPKGGPPEREPFGPKEFHLSRAPKNIPITKNPKPILQIPKLSA
jgi:hypothetical protein